MPSRKFGGARQLFAQSHPRQWVDRSSPAYKRRAHSNFPESHLRQWVEGSSAAYTHRDHKLLAIVLYGQRLNLKHPSMKRLLESSTNADTQVMSRHQAVIRQLTLNIAPNIRPPMIRFGFLQSIVASWRDQSSIRAPGPMKIDSHSSLVADLQANSTRPSTNTRKRPAAQSPNRHTGSMNVTSQPSFDATTAKLCVIDVVPHHDPAADQQLSCDCHRCLRLTTSLSNSLVKPFQLRIESHCHVSSLSHQEPQQSRAGFAYSDVTFSFSARSLHWLQANICDDRSLLAESFERLQGVNNPKSCQHANPRMSHQQLRPIVNRSLFLQPLIYPTDPLVNRDQKRDQVFGLMPKRWAHSSRLQLLLPGTAERSRSFRQAATHRYGLQVVTDHRPHLHQPCSVTQHSQDFNAFSAVAMDPGEIPFEHDLQDQLGIPTIIFLPPVCSTPNLVSMPHPYCVTKFFEHRFKPGAVSTGLQSHDHLAGELRVESANIVLAMVELYQLNFSIGRVTVSYRLHPGVEIHAAIYCSSHSASLQRSTVRRAPEFIRCARRGRHRFITSPLRGCEACLRLFPSNAENRFPFKSHF